MARWGLKKCEFTEATSLGILTARHMAEERTTHGWEWTAAQRDSIKVWRRAMENRVREVAAVVRGCREHVPEFASAAAEYGEPFLRQAAELLRLDARRGGKKWQDVAFSAVPEKLGNANQLYEEYRDKFLAREDVQAAIKGHNKQLRQQKRKILKSTREGIEKIAAANLEMLENLKAQPERLRAEATSLCDELKEFGAGVVFVSNAPKLSKPEVAALKRWVVIQYISTAARISPEVREHASQEVHRVEDPEALVPTVFWLLYRHAIVRYNADLRKSPEWLAFEKPEQVLEPFGRIILSTIENRLKDLCESGKSPMEFEFSLFDRDFGPGAQAKK